MLSFLAMALYTIIDVSHATDACGCNATAITGFDLNEYLGIWHQITTSFTFYEIFERSFPLCIYANYSANADGTVSVTNTGYNSKGEKDVARGTATQMDTVWKAAVAILRRTDYGSLSFQQQHDQ